MTRFSVKHVDGILLVGNAVEPLRHSMARSLFQAFWCRLARAVKTPFFRAAFLRRPINPSKEPTMRLPLIAPADLTPEQKPLYDDMRKGIASNFNAFKARARTAR